MLLPLARGRSHQLGEGALADARRAADEDGCGARRRRSDLRVGCSDLASATIVPLALCVNEKFARLVDSRLNMSFAMEIRSRYGVGTE